MNTHPLITFIGGKKASSLRDIEGRVRILVAAQNCETYFGYVEFLHCVQRRGGGDGEPPHQGSGDLTGPGRAWGWAIGADRSQPGSPCRAADLGSGYPSCGPDRGPKRAGDEHAGAPDPVRARAR